VYFRGLEVGMVSSNSPSVSIIIPHHGGQILLDCLASLFLNTGPAVEVILVDDCSPDSSVREAVKRFPQIKVVRNPRHSGFAVSCNRGIKAASGEYLVLLNNDTKVSPGWLSELVSFARRHPRLGACQPKILSWQDKRRFDYSGAAGGLIDIFGMPYALGRVLENMELDHGQYDSSREIFWASGTAIFIRREALRDVGELDEDFFAHMEEIDLCWRMKLSGFKIYSVPSSVIYHYSGWTLPADRLLKMYLNHRNSLMMLLKNYGSAMLLWILPTRLLLECLTILYSLLRLDLKRVIAVNGGLASVAFQIHKIWKKRLVVQALRRVSDSRITKDMFRGSIGINYFLGRSYRGSVYLDNPAKSPTSNQEGFASNCNKKRLRRKGSKKKGPCVIF